MDDAIKSRVRLRLIVFKVYSREPFANARNTTLYKNAPAAGTYWFVINSQVQRTAAIRLPSPSLLSWLLPPPSDVAVSLSPLDLNNTSIGLVPRLSMKTSRVAYKNCNLLVNRRKTSPINCLKYRSNFILPPFLALSLPVCLFLSLSIYLSLSLFYLIWSFDLITYN